MNKRIFLLLDDIRQIMQRLQSGSGFFSNNKLPQLTAPYIPNRISDKYNYMDKLLEELDYKEIDFLENINTLLKNTNKSLEEETSKKIIGEKANYTYDLESELKDHAEYVIEEFVEELTKSQLMSKKVYNALAQNFSLLKVPLRVTQDLAAQSHPEKLESATLEWLDVKAEDLTVAGKPNLEKFIQAESKDHRFGIEISANTSYSDLMNTISEAFPGIMDFQDFKIISEQAFLEKYKEMYKFLYDQFLNIGISIDDIKQNFDSKYKNLNQLFIKSYKNYINYAYEEAEVQLKESIRSEAQTIIKFLKELAEEDFYSFKYPRVYELKFRELSEFEKDHTQSYFATDLYIVDTLHPNIDKGQMVASYVVSDSPNIDLLVDNIIFTGGR